MSPREQTTVFRALLAFGKLREITETLVLARPFDPHASLALDAAIESEGELQEVLAASARGKE